jgi:hypothetical protein
VSEQGNTPTPQEALAALRTARESKGQVVASALNVRWLSIAAGLTTFGYTVVADLVPATNPWLTWAVVAIALLLTVLLRTRTGGSLLGQRVKVSRRRRPPIIWSLVPIVGFAIVAGGAIRLLHIPHGEIYYGALAGLYIIFLGPRFQMWLAHRQDKD